MKIHLVRIYAALVLPAVLLCATEASPADLTRMTVGYSSIGPMATGFWMAKEIR